MKNLTVYLADLVHNSVVKGPFTIPLNIGYVAAYAKKYFGKDIDIKLFKFPLELLEAIKQNPPDILGLGHYCWNADLNYKIIEFAKACRNDLITALGGPNFPINQDEQRDYLEERPLVDFYVVNQGEKGFANLVKRVLSNSDAIGKNKKDPVNGCVFLSKPNQELVISTDEQIFETLDDIPSPYLLGLLDEFFSTTLNPLIETDRGCPYTCTFCAWGKTTNRKVRQFNIDRVKEELDYIACHVKDSHLLFIANANFGIFDRDEEIAAYIKQLSVKTGFPRKIDAAWAKNTPERIIGMAEMLGDMVEITMSFQSLDDDVLRNIKRANIKTSTFIQIQNHFAKEDVISSSEIILGLPGETKESHLNALRRLFDISAGTIHCYNLRALNGSVLNTRQQRTKYGIKTKYRLYDIGFGKYDDLVSIEADEIVRSTNTLLEEDMFFFRSLHWLIQFFWSYKYYSYILRYLQSEQIHPVDFMLNFISDRTNAPQAVKVLLSDFEEEARNECFDSQKELFDYYSREENFEKIMKGAFGKLNYKYMFRVLCGDRGEFDIHLADTSKKMLVEKLEANRRKAACDIVDNLIRYMRNICVDFDDNLVFKKEKRSRFNYDIASWKKDCFEKPLAEYHKSEGTSYLFYMPDEQYEALTDSIRQFRHHDRNVTLRKMSECIRKTDLLYKVLGVSKQEVLA
jgi:radical SAM superfamily enzyme YgiQ (UPF0313 family)